jgi:hypothetical protein
LDLGQVQEEKFRNPLFLSKQRQAMVITIHFQSEKDLKWLNKIVAILQKAAVHFEMKGVSSQSPVPDDLKQRRQAFLDAAKATGVITSKIEIPSREERNVR